MRPRFIDRLRSSQRLKDDPEAAFYVALNPTFATTAEAALMVWMPLDIVDIAGALVRGITRSVRGWLGRRRAEKAPPRE